MEIWKDIKEFEEHYQISSYGRVKRKAHSRPMKNGAIRPYAEKILSPCVKENLYRQLSFRKEGKDYHKYVHRLVAENFLPTPSKEKIQVNHKDGNVQNNHIENLEWVSPSENIVHSYKTGLQPLGEEHVQSKLKNKDVVFIKENYIPKHPQYGGRALAERFNVAPSYISRIVKGTKRKTI